MAKHESTEQPDQPEHEPDILDPVAATEPTAVPEKRRSWFARLFTGAGKASGGPAGPTQQTGGTPAP